MSIVRILAGSALLISRFPRIFGRRSAVKAATVQVHTTNGELPPWLRCNSYDAWPSPPPPEYYAPKRREQRESGETEPPPLDPETCLVISLSRERQLRLSRLLRHGYQLGASSPVSNAVPWKRAA